MKKSIFSVIAGALGIGAGGFNDSEIHIEPHHHEPSKKQTRSRSSRRLFGGTDFVPVIHTESNAAARRLRQMQSGMLKPQSRNINHQPIQAHA